MFVSYSVVSILANVRPLERWGSMAASAGPHSMVEVALPVARGSEHHRTKLPATQHHHLPDHLHHHFKVSSHFCAEKCIYDVSQTILTSILHVQGSADPTHIGIKAPGDLRMEIRNITGWGNGTSPSCQNTTESSNRNIGNMVPGCRDLGTCSSRTPYRSHNSTTNPHGAGLHGTPQNVMPAFCCF